MEWILLIIGIALLGIAYADILHTTIQHTGAGFISQKIGTVLWEIVLKISGSDGTKYILGSGGLIVVSSLILFWILCLWFGYTLIFNFQPDSILYTSSGLPTDYMDKIYYTGYTLSTLGNGDMMASNDFWRILTVINSISGLLIITLSITYLLPLLSAVTNKRKMCAYIHFLGSSPEEIIMKAWNGKDLSALNKYVDELSLMVLDHKEKQLLYPVLHYFHSTDKKFAAPIALSILDETISVLLASPHLLEKIDKISLGILRKSLDDYLEILKEVYINRMATTPYIPGLQILYAETGADRENIREYFGHLADRRALLHGMVLADGWTWPVAGEV